MGEAKTKAKVTAGRAILLAVLVVVVAASAIAVVAVVATGGPSQSRGGWASDWTYQRSTLANDDQRSAYDTAMSGAQDAHARGVDGLVWGRGCRMATYRVGATMGEDRQIGMLAGCADGMAAYWGQEE